MQQDKKLHVLAGFAAGIFPALLLAVPAGTVVASLAGVAKEYDDKTGKTRGTVDRKDALATMIGGILADAWVILAALGVSFLAGVM
jgi:hypothetical protein